MLHIGNDRPDSRRSRFFRRASLVLLLLTFFSACQKSRSGMTDATATDDGISGGGDVSGGASGYGTSVLSQAASTVPVDAVATASGGDGAGSAGGTAGDGSQPGGSLGNILSGLFGGGGPGGSGGNPPIDFPVSRITPEFVLFAFHGQALHCPSLAGSTFGWALTEETPVVTSGNSTLGIVCLYLRLRTDGYRARYLITHQGGSRGAEAIDCRKSPPSAGWTLHGGGCVYPNSDGTCRSDVCFWSRPAAVAEVVGLSHAGGNAGDDVDCSTIRPSLNLVSDGMDRVPLLSSGNGVYSDLCLWKYRFPTL